MGIIVENVSRSYDGKKVLDDISLEIQDGEFVTFLAPTGEGKTTLLRLIAGVERVESGRIYYDGRDVTDLPVQKRNIAMVYQWFINYPSMNVFENIASPLRVSKRKLSEKEIGRIVRETAELLRIDGLLQYFPSEISGGQQQRLAIARALAKGADYIFLDEPLTNLDYKLQEELRAELKNIFSGKKRGAVIFATPQPVEAYGLSTWVGFLHNTRLMQYGPVEEVYHNPSFVEVGAYFSHPSMNVFEARLIADGDSLWLRVTDQLKVDVKDFRESLTKEGYLLGIRAHALSTEKKGMSMLPVQAKVELAEVVGSDTELHLNHEGISLIALLQGVGTYELDQDITVFLDPSRFFIFEKGTGKLVGKTHLNPLGRDNGHD